MLNIDNMLQGHVFFSNLPPDIINRIAREAIIRQFPRQSTIFMQGESGDRLFGVMYGRVKISVFSEEGREVVLAVMQEGEFFGEIAVLDGRPRTADAIVLEPSQVFSIPRDNLFALMSEYPEINRGIIRTICERLRSTNKTVEDTVFLTVSARISKTMIRLANLHGDPMDNGVQFTIKISQQEIANMIGTSREVVNRHLRELKSLKIVSIRNGYIFIHDMEYLNHYSSSG